MFQLDNSSIIYPNCGKSFNFRKLTMRERKKKGSGWDIFLKEIENLELSKGTKRKINKEWNPNKR